MSEWMNKWILTQNEVRGCTCPGYPARVHSTVRYEMAKWPSHSHHVIDLSPTSAGAAHRQGYVWDGGKGHGTRGREEEKVPITQAVSRRDASRPENAPRCPPRQRCPCESKASTLICVTPALRPVTPSGRASRPPMGLAPWSSPAGFAASQRCPGPSYSNSNNLSLIKSPNEPHWPQLSAAIWAARR